MFFISSAIYCVGRYLEASPLYGLENIAPIVLYSLGNSSTSLFSISWMSKVKSYSLTSFCSLNFATLTVSPIIGLTSYTGVKLRHNGQHTEGVLRSWRLFGAVLQAEGAETLSLNSVHIQNWAAYLIIASLAAT